MKCKNPAINTVKGCISNDFLWNLISYAYITHNCKHILNGNDSECYCFRNCAWQFHFNNPFKKPFSFSLAYPGGSTPQWNLHNVLSCVFAKYTVQARLLHSLNPTFSTGKSLKLYTNFTFFSFWVLRLSGPCGTLPLDPPRGLPSSDPRATRPREPLHCKILCTPMFVLLVDMLLQLVDFASTHARIGVDLEWIDRKFWQLRFIKRLRTLFALIFLRWFVYVFNALYSYFSPDNLVHIRMLYRRPLASSLRLVDRARRRRLGVRRSTVAVAIGITERAMHRRFDWQQVARVEAHHGIIEFT